ncbi:DNA-binding protein [Opitutaceae bacterium TAV5]|nr:DNA-binding protein [Opitutaceae bacterium TAV5]
MKLYADTSFIGSLYLHSDANHGAAVTALERLNTAPQFPLTPFGVVEIENMLSRLEYKGILHSAEVRQIMKMIKNDIGTGLLHSTPLHAYEWLQDTRDLIRKITPLTGTRTLDTMHIALARNSNATHFASFDKNQRKAAAAAKLQLFPSSI